MRASSSATLCATYSVRWTLHQATPYFWGLMTFVYYRHRINACITSHSCVYVVWIVTTINARYITIKCVKKSQLLPKRFYESMMNFQKLQFVFSLGPFFSSYFPNGEFLLTRCELPKANGNRKTTRQTTEVWLEYKSWSVINISNNERPRIIPRRPG